jgi:Fe2+ or Zn2+ uptake regulation protein
MSNRYRLNKQSVKEFQLVCEKCGKSDKTVLDTVEDSCYECNTSHGAVIAVRCCRCRVVQYPQHLSGRQRGVGRWRL